MAVLAARARQAFFEYNPLPLVGDDPERIYRVDPDGPAGRGLRARHAQLSGANSENRQPALDAASARARRRRSCSG